MISPFASGVSSGGAGSPSARSAATSQLRARASRGWLIALVLNGSINIHESRLRPKKVYPMIDTNTGVSQSISTTMARGDSRIYSHVVR